MKKKMFLLQQRKVQNGEGCWFLHDIKLLIQIILTSTHFYIKLFVDSLIYRGSEEVEEEVDEWKRWCKREMKERGINIINPD